MNGWIKIFRAIKDWEWFTDVPTAHLWLYLLVTANYDASTWRGVDIPKGGLVTTEAKISYETGLSRQQIRTALKKLLSTNEITKTTTKEYTLITIVKYAEYQENSCDMPFTQMDEIYMQPTIKYTVEQPTTYTSEQPLSKKIRREEEKNIYNKRFKKPSIDEIREYCYERQTSVDPEKFWDYYESNGWKVGKNPMKDWKAAVRTWEKNSKDIPKNIYEEKRQEYVQEW